MKKLIALSMVLLFTISSITIVVATPEYSWEDGEVYDVAGYSQTSGLDPNTGVREGRDIVYHNGTWYFYGRYRKSGHTYYGYLLVNTTDYENPDDPFYVTPDNAMGDGGWPNWATHWYNKYTDELWFLWNKAYSSSVRDGNAYLTTYNFSNDTWVFNKLWKEHEADESRYYWHGFCYQPFMHTWTNESGEQNRLIMPITFKNVTGGDIGYAKSGLYYSDDYSQTWSCRNSTGDIIYVPGAPCDDVEENSIVEMPNGSLQMQVRMQGYENENAYFMWRSFSYDHGITWTDAERVPEVPIAITKSLLRNATLYGRNVYLFYSNHRPEGSAADSWCTARIRSNVSIWLSFDGINWTDAPHIINASYFGQGYDGTGRYVAYGAFIELNDTLYCSHYRSDTASCGSVTDLSMWKMFFHPKVLWTNPNIENGTIDVPLDSDFTMDINDYEGDGITWSIECSNGQSNSGSGESNGTKTLDLSGLLPNREYTIWANATGAWLNQTISFETEEGVQFTSINGGTNGSIIYDATPTINWTTVDTASVYWLQIDDDADFSSPEINYNDINEYNYPSNCDINTTRVSFVLPVSLSGYDTYYMRVRAYTR